MRSPLEDQCVISRQVTVATGVFAPGHLGELTQVVPFEMVDQALVATGTTQARVRMLPSRVAACLLLAGDNALWQARARLGRRAAAVAV
jgi:hypothetical protein